MTPLPATQLPTPPNSAPMDMHGWLAPPSPSTPTFDHEADHRLAEQVEQLADEQAELRSLVVSLQRDNHLLG